MGTRLSSRIISKAASYTVNPATDRLVEGPTYMATAAATFTLPTPGAGLLGVVLHFLCIADVVMTIAAATADTMVTVNDLAADSVAFSTSSEKIGSRATAHCVKNAAGAYRWVVTNSSSNTMTVTS